MINTSPISVPTAMVSREQSSIPVDINERRSFAQRPPSSIVSRLTIYNKHSK
jgi:hypothetical protein